MPSTRDQAPRPKGGASSGQVGLADYRLLRDTCPSSEEDASIGGTAPKPGKNQDLSWGNLSPKPPNEDDIPPRPEDGASCHGLVIWGFNAGFVFVWRCWSCRGSVRLKSRDFYKLFSRL